MWLLTKLVRVTDRILSRRKLEAKLALEHMILQNDLEKKAEALPSKEDLQIRALTKCQALVNTIKTIAKLRIIWLLTKSVRVIDKISSRRMPKTK